MSRFIELHLYDESNPTSLIVNTDWIAYLKPQETGCMLYLGTVRVDGHRDMFGSVLYSLHVMEDYYTVKDFLRCQQ